MIFPEISEETRISRLRPAEGQVDVVLDTDTFNEIDDQFAVVHALLSPERLNVQALYAAPFFNKLSSSPGDGMEKSYRELMNILEVMQLSDHYRVYRGSESYLSAPGIPVASDAARDLVSRAMAATQIRPLYVVAIGALTNVASAILLEPNIIERIVVVWLGGHSFHWPHTKEFNLIQDMHASRLILDCGVPLALMPCSGASSHLITTLDEINGHVRGYGRIGNFLAATFERSSKDHVGYSRVLWDLAATSYLICPDAVSSWLTPSPVLTDQQTWSQDPRRHLIRCAYFFNRNRVFQDLFKKLRDADA